MGIGLKIKKYKVIKKVIKKVINMVDKVLCKTCDKYISKNKYRGHLKTKRHIANETGDSQFKGNSKVKCTICDCMILRKSLKKHESTKKHINNDKGIKKVIAKVTHCMVCKKDISTVNISTHNKTKKHRKNMIRDRLDYKYIEGLINKIRDTLPNAEIEKEGKELLLKILNESETEEEYMRIDELLTYYISDNGDIFY